MSKFLDDADKAALLAGLGASIVPLFIGGFGGPVATVLFCIGAGFGVYKLVDYIF